MATNYSLHQTLHHSLRRRHSIDCPPSSLSSSPSPSPAFLKPTSTTTPSSLSSITFSLSSSSSSSSATSTTPPSTSQTPTTFDLLLHHLSTQNFRQADEETRRLLIALAGDPAVKRGYVFFSEVQFISPKDLKAIDDLWKQHSDGKFGYSVQKKIWNRVNRDFTSLFIKLGWMKKLDTEVVQFNYRAFPDEFMWELNDETPMGHLPLTNALRGTQLMSSILNHPAFEEEDGDEEKEEEGKEIKGGKGNGNGGLMGGGLRDSSKILNKRVFKTDYSF